MSKFKFPVGSIVVPTKEFLHKGNGSKALYGQVVFLHKNDPLPYDVQWVFSDGGVETYANNVKQLKAPPDTLIEEYL